LSRRPNRLTHAGIGQKEIEGCTYDDGKQKGYQAIGGKYRTRQIDPII